MGTEDKELMVRASRGDMDAFEELVRRHQQAALDTAFHFLGDPRKAEDIAQEAFLRVLERAESYRPTAAFRTYLFTIIWHLCVDAHRRETPVSLDSLRPRAGGVEDPAEATFRRERALRVRRGLDELPPRQRMALVLKYFQEMSYREISEVMDCSVSAVDSLLSRARNALREQLGEHE